MIRVATKLSRAAKTVARSGIVFGRPPPVISHTPPLAPPPPPLLLSVRSLSTKTKTTTEGNPVALEMINYAISYARSGKSGFPFSSIMPSSFSFWTVRKKERILIALIE